MMQAADFRNGDDRTTDVAIGRLLHRSVLVQRQVSARMVVVPRVGPEEPRQVAFIQYDHVIRAFPANGSDEPLHRAVLPR